MYVSFEAQGQGVGRTLLNAMIAASEAEGFWTLQSQIMAANTASRALHARCGFREVGIRERFGQIKGVWHDVVLLERRSIHAGGPNLPTRRCDAA